MSAGGSDENTVGFGRMNTCDSAEKFVGCGS
jgi:hypothetical protein